MKKINLLIPAIVAVTASPFIGLTSCTVGGGDKPEPTPPKPIPIDAVNCLRFTAELDDAEIELACDQTDDKWPIPNIYGSDDEGVTQHECHFNVKTSGEKIQLKKGKSIIFWGDNPNGFSYRDENGDYFFGFNVLAQNANVSVSGNIMSLIDNGKCKETQIPCKACFEGLFNGSDIVSAKDLILPSKLTEFCYCDMFNDCRGLIDAPQLPAINLPSYCYFSMFMNCNMLPIVQDEDDISGDGVHFFKCPKYISDYPVDGMLDDTLYSYGRGDDNEGTPVPDMNYYWVQPD